MKDRQRSKRQLCESFVKLSFWDTTKKEIDNQPNISL